MQEACQTNINNIPVILKHYIPLQVTTRLDIPKADLRYNFIQLRVGNIDASSVTDFAPNRRPLFINSFCDMQVSRYKSYVA